MTTESSKIVRYAVLGCGARGQHFADWVHRNPDQAQIVAVADPRADRRDLIADAHHLPAAMRFETWESLLSRPKFADAVIITLMDQLNAPSAIKALDAGYHMMLEKPMAVTLEDCLAIDAARKRTGRIAAICHSLRYHPTYAAIKKLLDENALGDIVSIDQLEGVDPTHQAHSFVRGNWGNESRSTFMLMAKSCHDIDIICHLMNRPCERVSSFGQLSHFNKANKPPGAPARCTDGCPVENECPYSTLKHYRDGKSYGRWIGLNHLTADQRMEFLQTSPYGRCVYDTDNDVVDHQVVNFQFKGGATGTFTMTAFAPGGRRLRLHGTKGFIDSHIDKHVINLTQYWPCEDGHHYREETINVEKQEGGHGGGDDNVMNAITSAIRQNNPSLVLTDTNQSLQTHAITFAAEISRRTGQTVSINDLMK